MEIKNFKKSRYKELNDKDWLYDKYWVQGLSTLQIAKLIGAKQPNSVRQALIKFGIEVRGYRQGQINGRTDEVINCREVIDGSLLGDAYLQKSNKNSNECSPYLAKKNIHFEHVEWFAKQVCGNFTITKEVREVKLSKGKSVKKYTHYQFRTLSSDKLRLYFNRWYPKENGYKKVVPLDLKLTPKMILNWYLDDGYCFVRDRSKEYEKIGKGWEQRTKQVSIGFCSESFTKEENEFLAKQLIELGIKCRIGRCNSGTGYRVIISQLSAKDFLELIGPCPVKALEYKWNFS